MPCFVLAALSRHEHPLPSFPRNSLNGNEFDERCNRIGDAGAAALSEALKSNATLTSLT